MTLMLNDIVSRSSRKVDTVYMADGESNMLAVRLWDGLKVM